MDNTQPRTEDLCLVCDGHKQRIDAVEDQIKKVYKNSEESAEDRKSLHIKIDNFHIKQLEQGVDIKFIKNALPKTNRLVNIQITTAILIAGFIMTFIFWQTQRIITLQDRSIETISETVKNEKAKDQLTKGK